MPASAERDEVPAASASDYVLLFLWGGSGGRTAFRPDIMV